MFIVLPYKNNNNNNKTQQVRAFLAELLRAKGMWAESHWLENLVTHQHAVHTKGYVVPIYPLDVLL